MVATAVGPAGTPGHPDELQAARVEQFVSQVVAQGAEEPLVRALVREATRLGRGARACGAAEAWRATRPAPVPASPTARRTAAASLTRASASAIGRAVAQ